MFDILAYAAALDLYARYNASWSPNYQGRDSRGCGLSDLEVRAMLKIVDWEARPAGLEK